MTESTPSVIKAKDMPRSTLEARIAVLASAVSALRGVESRASSEQEELQHELEISAWLLCEYLKALTDLYVYEIADEGPECISNNWQEELERLAK